MIRWQGKSYSNEALKQLLEHRLLEASSEEWERRIYQFALEWLDEKKAFFEVQTSGSTGKPKRIQLTRKQMVDSAHATQEFLGLKQGDKALLVLPAQFIAGKMMIVRALEIGMDLYFYPPQISVLKNVKQSFDFAALIPLQVQYALNNGFVSHLNRLKKIIIGGAALHPKYISQLQNIDAQIFATYGMTETITHVAMRDLKDPKAHYNALPGIAFQKNENDCLLIKSDRLPDSITETNDVVGLITKKEFAFKGRADHMINSGGLKIHPEEIEERIQEILGVDVFIGFEQDEDLGQKLVMVIEAQEERVNESMIFEYLSVGLDKNKLPKKVLAIPQLLRTENDKISRKLMQEWIQKNREHQK